jgi:hypothetical protein
MPQFLPSELPVRATTRQHWIVLFRRVHRRTLIVFAVLLLLAILWPDPWVLALIVMVLVLAAWRYLLWRNERIYLTSKRIVRMEGIPAVTRHEAWLRVDRISGAQFREEWPGTWLDYATIDLEAPGDHPGVRHLIRVGRANPFYLTMRDTVFGEVWSPDPDEDSRHGVPTDYVTEPLPRLDLDKQGHGRRSRRER